MLVLVPDFIKRKKVWIRVEGFIKFKTVLGYMIKKVPLIDKNVEFPDEIS